MKPRYQMYQTISRNEINRHTMHIAYEGVTSHQSRLVIAQIDDGGRWYVFEQFGTPSMWWSVTLIADRYDLIAPLVVSLEKGSGHGI